MESKKDITKINLTEYLLKAEGDILRLFTSSFQIPAKSCIWRLSA